VGKDQFLFNSQVKNRYPNEDDDDISLADESVIENE